MTERKLTILELLEFPQGLEIDGDEGWSKLVERQFGGEPARAFAELIQNFLDSHPSSIPWEDRLGEIETGDKSISITDYGEGMDRKRLQLITTMGGTDKKDDPSKIGAFGIGFFSIFNPRLGTKKVRVNTKCEDYPVELVFIVEQPGKRPTITSKVLDKAIPYSTRISVEFDNEKAPRQCLKQAEKSLQYYRCRVLMNGEFFTSVWEEAKDIGAEIFQEGECDGFLTVSNWHNRISLLCKYEHVTNMRLAHLITGGHNMTNDLRDFANKEVPFLPHVGATINCNNLRVTISRDSFYLDSAYGRMVKILARQLLLHLGKLLDSEVKKDVILANQYVLRKKIKAYMDRRKQRNVGSDDTDEREVLRKLSEAKVYRVNGRRKSFSLADIQNKLSQGTPVFFSPQQTNLRWVDGAFKHDFIVLPPKCEELGGAPLFYDTLFETIFEDVVNLDRIKYDDKKIRKLIDRGIVDKSALSPTCKFVGERRLSQRECQMVDEIDKILRHKEVKNAIVRHLHLAVSSIKTVFFEVDEQGATIATGLFDKKGKALSDPDNCDRENHEAAIKRPLWPRRGQDIMLGLRLDHPFIRYLIETDDPHKAYYTLTFLAHELSLCQKLLVPYSPFYHKVKEELAADMRRALMTQLLPASATA